VREKIMSCPSITFNGVSQEVIDCLKAKLTLQGITGLQNNSGTLSGHGVTVDYLFDSVKETLTIVVQKKPWIISCGHVTGAIHDALVTCGEIEPSPPSPLP
jgi:hypothetical protein